MTRQEAIWYLEPIANSASLERYKEALTLGISALREKEEREKPQPLTLDELRQMNGELAYIQFGDGECGYAVISTDRFRNIDLDCPDVIINHSAPDKDFLNMEMKDDPYGHFGLHLLGWRAYRQKPEEAIP